MYIQKEKYVHVASNGNISAYQCCYIETFATTSPTFPGRVYLGIRPFFVLKERAIFERVALRWAEFQPANSQKFKYLGHDIEVSN